MNRFPSNLDIAEWETCAGHISPYGEIIEIHKFGGIYLVIKLSAAESRIRKTSAGGLTSIVLNNTTELFAGIANTLNMHILNIFVSSMILILLA